MSVIPLTIFFSLLLAGVFILLFARVQANRPLGGAERDSLMPLASEVPHAAATQKAEDHRHEHAATHGKACGCLDGSRPPCAGCLKRPNKANARRSILS